MEKTKKLVDKLIEELENLENRIESEKDPVTKQALALYGMGYIFAFSFCCYMARLTEEERKLNNEKK